MTEEMRNKGLGRGLSALFGEDEAELASLDRVQTANTVPIERLEPNPHQPRKAFIQGDIEALAASIRAQGILQPILVRRSDEKPDSYQILAGERRWRAAQLAQLHQVPIIVKEISDEDALELALVENLQRQDLTAIEEADGYQRLIDEFSQTQEQIAQTVGKSRSHVANTLRLLTLPESIQNLLQDGKLTAGHGRALLATNNPLQLVKDIIERDLSVRQAERLAKQPSKQLQKRKLKDANTAELERNVSHALGLVMNIEDWGPRGGRVTINYKTLEQLDDLCQRLCKQTQS
tara:strand:+ start:2495 stop:3367 length:873 start_codon:yes stop_codon:yes gene_type:complete